ncbi:MAG: DMT family transporter [Bacteroidales bacterium]|nr:DMT family transporter [Bacteroidales bacterium]
MIKQNKNIDHRLLSWIILVGLVLTWGSSFILMKKGLIYFTGEEVGLIRISIAFLFLLPFAIKRIMTLDRKYFILLTISGTIGSLIPALLFAISETRIDSALAGTLNSLTPLFALTIGLTLFKQKTKWFNVMGVFIGLVGALGIILSNSKGKIQVDFLYSSLVIFATILYGINVNFVKHFFKGINALTITVMSFFFIGIPTIIYTLLFTPVVHKLISRPETWHGIGYIAILAVAGSGLALIAYNHLIKLTTAVFASSVTYLIPTVAILWGVLDGEQLAPGFFLWFLVILTGVFLVNAKSLTNINLASKIIFWKNK